MQMKPRSLKQWIDFYEKKTGDKADLPFGYKLVYLAHRGFIVLHYDSIGKMIVAYEVCGDGTFWRDYCELLASENGAECIASICTRPVLPYIKAFGWEVIKDEVKDGHHRYHCQDAIGRLVILTYMGEGERCSHYYVTQYLNRKYSEGSDI